MLGVTTVAWPWSVLAKTVGCAKTRPEINPAKFAGRLNFAVPFTSSVAEGLVVPIPTLPLGSTFSSPRVPLLISNRPAGAFPPTTGLTWVLEENSPIRVAGVPFWAVRAM